jgi:hypothetical protein
VKATDIYSLFEAQQELFEVEMSPSSLRKLAAAIPGVKVGMEFEMVVPGVKDPDDEDTEPEEDFDADERADDIEDIIRFFSHEDDYMGQVNDPSDLRDLEEELREKFYEYMEEQIRRSWIDEDGKEYFVDWVKNNVDPDEVAEFAETPEDLFGEKNPSKEDYENFIEDQWTTEGSYYDEAYDSYRSEKQDEGDFSESDFLREIGIRNMSDVNDNIRMYIRWPYYAEPYYGEGGEDIETIGDEFSDAIGKRVYTSTSYHGARRAPDAYSLEPDSSIDASSGDAGLEFISPPMSVDEMIEDLNAVGDWAREKGCYTNRSTGLHINVSIPDYSLDKLDYVKLAILLGDKYILEQFGRLSNSYARSSLDIIKDRAKDNEDVDRLLKQLKGNVEGIASKILHSGRTDKYTSINTKDGYVEFRSAGGDWLTSNFDKIENTMLRYIVALDAACDPNKYKKEYYKGLYKVLKPKDEKSDLSMFARYMSGEITRSEYAETLEKQRKERFRDQGIRILQKDEVEENDWEVTYDDGKKSNTIYIANTDKVPDDEAAFKAAQKFKPQWFKPDTIEYVTVKPFKFGEELNDLKLYRAEFGHRYTGVVAKDEEQAREFVKIMNPELFEVEPDREITLTDDLASKRQISQILDWQENKLEQGREYIKRPKIWIARGRGSIANRYYIAAVKRDEAIEIANRLDPDIVQSQGFDIYVNDAYPDQDTFDAYTKAQNDLISDREAREEPSQEPEIEVPIDSLKVYRITNTELNDSYVYIVAENGGEAAEIARKLDPDKFGYIPSLTAQEQTGSSFTPLVITNMHRYQQEKLRDLSAQSSAPKFEVNDRVEVASGYPSLIGRQGKVLQVSPNYDFVSVLIDGNDTPSSFPTSTLKKAEDATQPAEESQFNGYQVTGSNGSEELIAARSPGEAQRIAMLLYPNLGDNLNVSVAGISPGLAASRYQRHLDDIAALNNRSASAPRVSNLTSYRVQNVDTGESRYFAAGDMQDAIARAREQYPAMFPQGAALYARPHEPGQR